MGKNLREALSEGLEEVKAQAKAQVKVAKPAVSQKGSFYKRRPSVNLKVEYPGMKMQGVVKNTIIKLKGTAFKTGIGFERRTCANPVVASKAKFEILQTNVDTRLATIASELKLSADQVGYINGHMTNHFNDYVTIK